MQTANEILHFWFADALTSPERADARANVWFAHNDDFDGEIERRFGSLPALAQRGSLDAWRGEPSSALAFVLVTDQFPRNLYRRDPRAFAFDHLAREATLDAIARGFDDALHPLQASFFYLPFEHAEDIGLQERGVERFERLAARASAETRSMFENFASYARRHREVIRRFGRFPHRNDVLGRQATPEETAYLEAGGDRFG